MANTRRSTYEVIKYDLAKAILEEKRLRHIGQVKFAKLTGISQPQVSRLGHEVGNGSTISPIISMDALLQGATRVMTRRHIGALVGGTRA